MQLPVLTHLDPPDSAHQELAEALSRVVRGGIRFGPHDRMLYATDASMYQVEPIGVVTPADADDVVAALRFCSERTLAILPRGGGTSLAGQCTNHAVVIDTSPSLRAIGQIQTSPDGGSCRAEAGVTPDDLNAELTRQKTGLFFAPDPATVAQACLGGCIGNNAAGSRSIKYGRTVDSVLEIEAALADGTRVTFGPGAGRTNPTALRLAEGVAAIVTANAQLIRDRYPKTLRRNAGYALDMILAQLDAGVSPVDLDLTRLLCGSEGTLALTLAARLRLFPIPKFKGLALVSFPTVDDAIAPVPAILTTGPSAVELVDDVVIEAALNNRECAPFVKAFPTVGGQPPKGVLYVEYQEATQDALNEKFARLRALIGSAPLREVIDAPGIADAWKLRKAGEPLLHGLPGHRKPLTFVEDNAVPPERLGEFVREFRAIVQREGTRAAFWAHASVGVLHVRPMLDPHDEMDLDRLQRIAIEAADLAKRCGGVMSGEHGDGRVRGPLLERYFGPELMAAFAQVKALFDPKGLLNPGNIVAPASLASIVQHTRIEPRRGDTPTTPKPTVPTTKTYYTYEDHHGFDGAVERCNGAGVCRKNSGGTMCPSYRATADERHSTRGRGNALRLAITGQLSSTPGTAKWDDPATIETLDLCLGCKACKTECPSNVDIARLKSEYTAQRYKTQRPPLRVLITGRIRLMNRLGALFPNLANAFIESGPGRALLNRVMKMHPSRTMPRFSPSLFKRWSHETSTPPTPNAPRVILFSDCFTTYNESDIGIAAKRVLNRLGYTVDLPDAGCCARSMISMGLLKSAINTIDSTIARLQPYIEDPAVKAILFAEPSCLAAVKDDWLQLKCKTPLALRQQLAAKSLLIEEFIDRAWADHPNQSTTAALTAAGAASSPVALHGHCQQKALWGVQSSSKAIARAAGPNLKTLDTGCCGMCGAFGYDQNKYDLSMTIANLPAGGVMPAITASGATTVLAPGTSCRHQIKDASSGGIHALHPIQYLDHLLS